MHLYHIQQYAIRNRNVNISVLNGALWGVEQVNCEFVRLVYWLCTHGSDVGTRCHHSLYTKISEHSDEFSSLVTAEVEQMITSSAASDENVVKIMVFPLISISVYKVDNDDIHQTSDKPNWYFVRELRVMIIGDDSDNKLMIAYVYAV